MAGFPIEITVDMAEVVKILAELDRMGADMSGEMREIGDHLVESTQHRFETGTAPDGRAWPPSRRAVEQGGRTLVDQGHLRDSITYAAGRDRVEIGTNVPYAPVHQFGARIRPRFGKYLRFTDPSGSEVFAREVHIPPRPFLGIDEEDEEEIVAILRAAIRSIIAGEKS